MHPFKKSWLSQSVAFVVTDPVGQPVEPMVLSGAVTLTRQ